MTVEEKRAVQTILLDELRQQNEAQPTLLFDMLMSGQAFQWVHHVVARRHGQHTQLAQMTDQLLRALKTAPVDEQAA